jgi:N-acylneuraminate cytidylyltransferase
MIDGKSVLAIIPARGGSKGVLRKNICSVGGKPLIAWTIEEARKSRYIDRLILSSEDAEIITVAKTWGCEVPFVRPAELAQDETPGIAPVLHAIQSLPGYDYLVLLQPTSPLRNTSDIDSCLELCVREGIRSCVSVTEPRNSPYWMYLLDAGGRMKPLIETEQSFDRRQELPKVYVLNGAVYVAECEWILNYRTFVTAETKAYLMPKERSIDIDSELDLIQMESIIRCRVNHNGKENQH